MNVMSAERSQAGRETEQAIRETLYQAADALDREAFDRFLDFCGAEFEYRISAYSPEIRREMILLLKDSEGMHELLSTLSKHNRDRTPIVRHWSLLLITPSGDANGFDVVSTLQVYRTEMDGGVTSLYAVGRYLDRLVVADGRALLVRREVRLETRMLGTGYHVPF